MKNGEPLKYKSLEELEEANEAKTLTSEEYYEYYEYFRHFEKGGLEDECNATEADLY